MLIQCLDTTADFAVALLIHYSFDLGGHTASELIDHWLKDYPANWVRFAVIEALYQGRYKAISVEQILAVWDRRGQVVHHFNHEFERLICNKFPQMLTEQPYTTAIASPPVSTAVDLGNGHDLKAFVTAEKSASATDAHTASDQISGEPTQRKSHQTSGNEKMRAQAGMPAPRRGTPAPPSDNPPPIEQFTPVDESSYFYTKLKAIAQQGRKAPDQETRR